MTGPVNFYADPSGLAALKKSAGEQDPKALRATARQFESLFTQMMMKSMRDASKSFGSEQSLMDNDQTDFYREMFDNQLATQLSKGKGIGLADMLVKQLQAKGAVAAPDAASKASAGIATKADGLEIGARQNFIALPKSGAIAVMTAPTTSNSQASTREDIAAQFAALISQSAPSGVSGPRDANLIAEDSGTVDGTNAIPTSHESPVTSHDVSSDTSTSTPRTLATTPADFVSQLWPHAEAAGRELGVDPRTLIAHAALETGWGKNVPCNPDGTCSNNLFGIKAGGRWRGSSVGITTVEFQDGVAVKQRASFRAYDSPADSFRDYATMIKNSPRYAAALGSGTDAAAFANALQQGGYATDPNYATKLAAVADRLGTTLKTNADRPLPIGRSVSSGGET